MPMSSDFAIIKAVKERLVDKRLRAVVLTLLFVVSGVGASVLMNPAAASPATAAPAAAPAVTQAEANWEYPNGNAFGQDYNPQNQINSSNIQYLGLSWIYPLPALPTSLNPLAGSALGTSGVGVDPLIVNGTAFVMTQYDEVIAFDIANGDVLWTFLSPLAVNQTAGEASGAVLIHAHDGTETFTTATFGSGVSGPTFWFQGGNNEVYAIDALSGKQELNFSDYTGLAMVPGNNPESIYNPAGASNISINPQLGILVNSMGSATSMASARGFFAGWNLNANPPTMKWITFVTPPQPGSGVAADPDFDIQMINNMTGASTFYPGENGSANGYTTPTEVQGGVLMNVNNDIVVNWKSLSQTQLNASLYNDWGYVDQSPQCQAITGGASTGSTGAGWGGEWIVGSGQTAGLIFVGTNNKDPYVGPCNPGPNLWSAATLALNMTTGQIVWGFQANAHDLWDYDCSWYWGMANETISGVNTEVILKTCKNGYMYEINAVTGNLIWAWDPPAGTEAPGSSRCPVCYMWNPLNATQMNFDYPTAMTNCAPTFTAACISGPQPPFLAWPSEIAGFEDEQAYDPATNMIYATSHLVPYYTGYVPVNSSTYTANDPGITTLPCSSCGTISDNATTWGINALTGQIVWSTPIPDNQGYRGQTDVSGNLVFMTLSSGDILMLNASTGKTVRDYYIGAPMDVGVSIGASDSGQEFILVPVGTCSFEAVTTCPGSSPGDILALALTTPPPNTSVSTSGSTSIVTSVSVSVSTTTVGGSVSVSTTTVTSSSNSAALYGVAIVAVIFIIATGYLAMRGRKPGS
jgi:hypothetical protein